MQPVEVTITKNMTLARGRPMSLLVHTL